MASLHKKWLLGLLLVLSGSSWASGVLRIGVADTDPAPIAVLSDDGNHLQGGMSREIGELLAGELQLPANFVLLARKRVEMSIEAGKVDIICNANPGWFDNAARLGWSHEIYPQLERVASLPALPTLRQLDDMGRLRIATLHGYQYPTLEYLWGAKRSQRVEEDHFELLLKSLQKHLSDVAVVSELSFAWWARQHPAEARGFKLHPLLVSSLPTMCALSPRAAISLEQLNRAIERLHKNGKFKALLARYQWQTD